ncbi:DUF5134 domain-containing protein [Streptomyces sp. NPDC002519]
MIAATGLRWILTAVFALSALHGGWQVARPGYASARRVDHGLHTLMGLAMIAMVWPWGMDLPAAPQVVLFGAGAVWFARTAPSLLRSGSWLKSGAVPLPHVVMTAAMAWMVAVMASAAMSAGHGGGGASGDMPGMIMSGGSGTASMSLTGTGERLTAGLLAVVLAVVGLRWLGRAFDRARTARATEPGHDGAGSEEAAFGLACHAAMALGMAAMFVLLL